MEKLTEIKSIVHYALDNASLIAKDIHFKQFEEFGMGDFDIYNDKDDLADGFDNREIMFGSMVV